MNNKKAYFEYEIKDEYTAGLSLLGNEVKSLRQGEGNLNGSYCYIHDGEIFIKGFHIKAYKNSCTEIDPDRIRKLLLKKKEIEKIDRKLQDVGMTLIPLKVLVGKQIKITIGVAKGKKLYDKRQTIKARDLDRDMER